MSIPYSSNATHNATAYAAELTFQNAVAAAGGNQAAINSAAITFHRAVGRMTAVRLLAILLNAGGAQPRPWRSIEDCQARNSSTVSV